jgi:hypothetical protein
LELWETVGAKTHCQQWSEHHPRDRTRLIVGMTGLLGFGFGFSFPKIGVLVAIAVGPKAAQAAISFITPST